jgi:hypothetical protein
MSRITTTVHAALRGGIWIPDPRYGAFYLRAALHPTRRPPCRTGFYSILHAEILRVRLYVPRPLITANPPASGITCHLCQSFIFISSSMPALDGISTLPILYETFSRCSAPPRFPLRVVDVNFRRVLRCLGQGVDCRISGRKHALSMPSYRAPTFFDMTLTCARGGAPFLIWKEDNEIARRQTSSSDRGIPCGWAHDARERGVFAQAWYAHCLW